MGIRADRILIVVLTSTILLPVFGQEARIRARISGGGGDGKCTFEVEVDGVAEVEVRGDEGYLRTISGNPARWRRLDCNKAMPRNPNDFRFKGIDGRGSQNLIRDPNSNRGIAVVRLEDPKGGSEGYTGDLSWRGGSDYSGGFGGRGDGFGGRGGRGDGGAFGGSSGGSWGGQGWNNGWGNNLRFTGRGSGDFDRDGGPRYDLRGVTVSVDRSSGGMNASFDTNEGRSTISFAGRVTSINNDTIEANLVSGNHRGRGAAASGRMRIRMNNNSTVRAIEVDGDVDNGRFRLNWRD